MRAQFAVIEAAMAMFLIVSAVSFTAAELSVSNRNYYSENSKLMQSIAIYDAADQISRNASANECIALSTSGSSPGCMGNLTKSYEIAFGLEVFEIIAPGLEAGKSASNRTIRCFPVFLRLANGTREICFIAGS